jgi:hypothetical protein
VRDDDEHGALGPGEADSSADSSAQPGGVHEAEAEPPSGPAAFEVAPAAAPELATPAGPSGPKLLRELRGRDKWLRVLAIAFTLYHLIAMLVGGSVSGVRRAFKPLTGFYSEGLRMTNGWGMFARAPTTSHVVIEATMSDGSKRVVSTTRAGDRSAFERIRDVRIRKIQGKLGEPGDRAQLGHAILDYFCRTSRTEQGPKVLRVRAVGLAHELRDDDGNVTRKPTELTLLTRSCGEPIPPMSRRPGLLEQLEGRRRRPNIKEAPNQEGDL